MQINNLEDGSPVFWITVLHVVLKGKHISGILLSLTSGAWKNILNRQNYPVSSYSAGLMMPLFPDTTLHSGLRQ